MVDVVRFQLRSVLGFNPRVLIGGVILGSFVIVDAAIAYGHRML